MSDAPAAPSLSPIADPDRASILDALRGFALLGIFVSHVPAFSGFEFMTSAAQAPLDSFGVDRPLADLFEFLIRAKFYSLFSLLFGIGFAIQLESAARRGARFARHFARRLAVLFLIGLAHASLWYGDILKDYALIGFVLILVARSSPRTLLAAAGVVLMLRIAWPTLMFSLLARPDAMATDGDPAGAFDTLTHAFAGADLAAAFSANWALVQLKALQMIYDGKAISVLAMFLLGAVIGSLRLYRDPGAHRELFTRVLWLCAPIGLAGNIALVPWHAMTPDFPPTGSWVAEQTLAAVAVPALALAYAAGFARLWSSGGERILRNLAPAGQMALTTYVSQTLIGVSLFYGVGLGLGGHVGLAGGTLIAVLIFAAQAKLSALWLRWFRFGPLEWLWRRATYGAPVAFRRTGIAETRSWIEQSAVEPDRLRDRDKARSSRKVLP